MKRLLLIIALGCGLTAGELAKPTKAACAFCFVAPCINSRICGKGCVCIKRGVEPTGECVSIEALPR